jgi:choline dehydrogenase-like flavoprotein
MGSSLDNRLRVKGVKNLRVVDAASFANNVSGNIQSSVYATAEKAADMIKQDNGYAALKKVVA